MADDGNTFRCASTVKALLAGGRVPRTRDAAGAAGVFLLGSVPEPLTVFASIRAVEAGTSFFVDGRGRSEPCRCASIAATFARGSQPRTAAGLLDPRTPLRP